MARREVTVMLSGDGGDELFWGYTFRFGPVLKLAKRFRRPYWWRSGRHGTARVLRGDNRFRNLRWPTIGDWYRGLHSRLPDAASNDFFSEFPEWPEAFDLFHYDGWRRGETAQWLRWNEMVGHLTRVLLKVDRASMYHSLEVRVPLLDREVIDVATRVDWQSCLDLAANVGKIPLRRSLAKHVDFQSPNKLGFSVPMDEWLRGPLLPVFRDVVLGRPDILGLPLKRAALEAYLCDHVEGRADHSRWLWSLLSLALWSDRYLQRPKEFVHVI
jgi:asparagine synthase (glutamine-hydrolysing)